ncbi:uncharacterized protein [Arachis hypogaea]|uniref:uncharacterized protein n=1 Tax=Arachis hypogaea TaxID=3818 RepID=UPI003B211280
MDKGSRFNVLYNDKDEKILEDINACINEQNSPMPIGPVMESMMNEGGSIDRVQVEKPAVDKVNGTTLQEQKRVLKPGAGKNPQCLISDFNATLHDHERRGRSGFSGWPYTWRMGDLVERLDRGLCNLEWQIRFSNANIKHLPSFKSDHSLLYLHLSPPNHGDDRRRPFRFMASWLTHPDFSNMASLWKDYEEILFQKEVMCFQKSKCKWIEFGDHNTKYFHGTTLARRRTNKVDSLQDIDGNWVSDKITLKNMAFNFYFNLYSDDTPDSEFILRNSFPTLPQDDLDAIGNMLSLSEVKDLIFNMGSLKAPGIDNIQAVFYQNQWDRVGFDLYKLVKGIFMNPAKVGEINKTLITLILKVEPVINLKQMRSISLLMLLQGDYEDSG